MATYDKLIDLTRLGTYNTKLLELLADLTGAMQDEVNAATAQQVISPRDFTSTEHWSRFGPPLATIEIEDGDIKYTQTTESNDCGIAADINPFSCSESSPALIKIQLDNEKSNGVAVITLSTLSPETGTSSNVITKYSNATAGGVTQSNQWATHMLDEDYCLLALIADSRSISQLRINVGVLEANKSIYIKSATIYRNAAQMAEVLGLYD